MPKFHYKAKKGPNEVVEGNMVAEGSMEQLRIQAEGQKSLEEIFLALTGGPDMQKIAEYLGEVK